MSDRGNILDGMRAATFGDMSGVPQKSADEVRQAVGSVVGSPEVQACMSQMGALTARTAGRAIGMDDPSESLAASVSDAVQPQDQRAEPVAGVRGAVEAEPEKEDDGPDIGL